MLRRNFLKTAVGTGLGLSCGKLYGKTQNKQLNKSIFPLKRNIDPIIARFTCSEYGWNYIENQTGKITPFNVKICYKKLLHNGKEWIFRGHTVKIYDSNEPRLIFVDKNGGYHLFADEKSTVDIPARNMNRPDIIQRGIECGCQNMLDKMWTDQWHCILAANDKPLVDIKTILPFQSPDMTDYQRTINWIQMIIRKNSQRDSTSLKQERCTNIYMGTDRYKKFMNIPNVKLCIRYMTYLNSINIYPIDELSVGGKLHNYYNECVNANLNQKNIIIGIDGNNLDDFQTYIPSTHRLTCKYKTKPNKDIEMTFEMSYSVQIKKSSSVQIGLF